MHRADAIGKKIDNLLGGIGDAGLPHGFGLGTGTVAEGWIDQAIAFWEENA